MSSQTHTDETRLEDLSQLRAYMLGDAKPAGHWHVGTEHEKVGWWPDLGRYPTYEGPRGIGALLERMVVDAGWTATREGRDIVALTRDRAAITLEPGGQLELSGAPFKSLREMEEELDEHLAEVRTFSADLGIEWSSLGMAPIGTPADMPRMPKARYGIMRRYLPTRGRLALHMMHSTCTVQANYDFHNEVDAFRKLRASLLVQPIVTAAFANSTVVNGALVPERSFRARVWEHTDNDRYVFPPSFLEAGCGFEQYVDWALDVPMFFLYRGERYVDHAGESFRRFMEKGLGDETATVGDFALHLSTLFPDVRLKQYLEVRGADMGDRAHLLALPALHVGLLYDETALSGTLRLLESLDYEAWWALRHKIPVEGLDARLLGGRVSEVLGEIVKLAQAGLERLEPGSERMLDVLGHAAETGLCPADEVRARWTGDARDTLAATRIA